MNILTYHRIAANIGGEDRCELLKTFANPDFAVVIMLTADGVDAAEKCPADTPCDAVIDADLGAGHDLMAWVSWYGGSLKGGCAWKN